MKKPTKEELWNRLGYIDQLKKRVESICFTDNVKLSEQNRYLADKVKHLESVVVAFNTQLYLLQNRFEALDDEKRQRAKAREQRLHNSRMPDRSDEMRFNIFDYKKHLLNEFCYYLSVDDERRRIEIKEEAKKNGWKISRIHDCLADKKANWYIY